MSVPDIVFEKVCALIADGSLKKGERLPAERKLAEILGVSRPSIREAIRTLETLGMIDTRLGSGSYLTDDVASFTKYFVKRQTSKKYKLLEIMESRKVLECEIAYLAAQRISPADKVALTKALEDMVEQEDVDLFSRKDFVFHEVIAITSNNFFLLEMLKTVRELMFEANKQLIITRPGQKQTAINHHRRIYDALMDEDPERARQEMLLHIENVIQGPDVMLTKNDHDE
ncbi:MAG: FadR family transcriptional regulator [Deltaproteobacteria bacterium]|nr:FadR family transcriptional regulator [Deltaproteobacteria bacterium]